MSNNIFNNLFNSPNISSIITENISSQIFLVILTKISFQQLMNK